MLVYLKSRKKNNEPSRVAHGRVVKGVGHLGHDEAMEAGGREFNEF